MALEVEQTIPEWLRRRFVVREQKYYPNLGRNKMWNRMFPNKLDGPAVIQNLTARRVKILEKKHQIILELMLFEPIHCPAKFKYVSGKYVSYVSFS